MVYNHFWLYVLDKVIYFVQILNEFIFSNFIVCNYDNLWKCSMEGVIDYECWPTLTALARCRVALSGFPSTAGANPHSEWWPNLPWPSNTHIPNTTNYYTISSPNITNWITKYYLISLSVSNSKILEQIPKYQPIYPNPIP